MEFKNRASNSRIAAPNSQSDFAEAAYDANKTYEGLSLAGYTPTDSPDEGKVANSKYEAKIYSYEHLNEQDGGHTPSLVLTYTVDGLDVEKTHEVKFVTDPKGTATPMQLKRNHLYRIVLNEKHSDMTIAGKVEVMDWTAAETFSFNDLPFEKDLNASLLVNRFASKNVDESGLIYTDNQFGFSADNTPSASAYEAFMVAWASGKYVDKDNQHGTQYRVPTKNEWMLLLREKTEASSDCPFVCFQTGKMTASVFNESIQIGDMPILGQSYLMYDDGDKAVYALRFMDTEQAAAYCYKFDAGTGLSIKIIGLGKESTAQIDEVKAMAWTEPSKYIEITLPANGYYASTDATKQTLQEGGSKGYYWSATQEDLGTSGAWCVSFDVNEAVVTTVTDKGTFYTLSMISDYDTPVVSK